jgi:hypothetical protein
LTVSLACAFEWSRVPLTELPWFSRPRKSVNTLQTLLTMKNWIIFEKLCVVLLTFLVVSHSFYLQSVRQTQRDWDLSQKSLLYLRPGQAADLEACAYDLMKEAAERITQEVPSRPEFGSPGPISWCRRLLFKHISAFKEAQGKSIAQD